MKRLRLSSNHEMLCLDANTRLADSSSATPVLKIVCPSLVRLDADMKFQPALAASWTIEDDYRVFTFKLQENAYFHSGRPVTAEAVAWNYNRLFDSRVGSLLAVDYAGVESIRAIAKDTVEFRYPEPFPGLALPTLRADSYRRRQSDPAGRRGPISSHGLGARPVISP